MILSHFTHRKNEVRILIVADKNLKNIWGKDQLFIQTFFVPSNGETLLALLKRLRIFGKVLLRQKLKMAEKPCKQLSKPEIWQIWQGSGWRDSGIN